MTKDPNFWLEFQVVSDGYEKAEAAPTINRAAEVDRPPCRAPAPRFSHFGDLPAEIRLQIWDLLITPRVVAVACVDAAHREAKRAQLARRARRPPVPVLLHINRETRDLALKHYELSFPWKVPHMLAEAGDDDRDDGSRSHRQQQQQQEDGEEPQPARRLAFPARVWFNYAQDTLFFLGELEPCDPYGFNTPMVYFLRRDDTRRVMHVACAFEALGYGEVEDELIFGALFHIVDRFPLARRLLVTSTPQDLETHRTALGLPPTTNNAIAKIWWGWINGTSVVTSSLASRQILMVREDELAEFTAVYDV